MVFKDAANTDQTVTIQHFGADGRLKPIWQENRLARFLISRGIISPHFPKVRFLLGSWGFSKVMKA